MAHWRCSRATLRSLSMQVVMQVMMMVPQTVYVTQPRKEGELMWLLLALRIYRGGAVCPVVLHRDPLTDRKSTFQAHAVQVNTTEQVSQFNSILVSLGLR
jgi:hypothetical protein